MISLLKIVVKNISTYRVPSGSTSFPTSKEDAKRNNEKSLQELNKIKSLKENISVA